MATIITRIGKGSELTWAELDANFTNLNNDKYQAGDNASFGTLTTAGNAGIGEASTGARLHVRGSGDIVRVTNGSNSAYVALDSAGFSLLTGAAQTGSGIYASASAQTVQLWTNGTSKATWNTAGDYTGTGGITSGKAIEAGYGAFANGGFRLKRYTSDANSRTYRLINDALAYGDFFIQRATDGTDTAFSNVIGLEASTGHLRPGADNTQTLGTASFRWSVVYAGTGTINTSDARQKTEVRGLNAAELAAAKQLAKEVGAFKFLAAVEAKGDQARQHIGTTVQRAIQVMESHGLDPFAYGFICYDEWAERVIEHPEQTETTERDTGLLDAEGGPIIERTTVVLREAWTETIPAGSTYGFRTDELLLFIAAGFNARLEAIEEATH